MRISINNLDGRGAVDYSRWVMPQSTVTVQRRINEPSRCTALLALGDFAPLPVRHARVSVSNDAGELLFTGYVATEPVQEYIGESSEGASYCARLTAVSDEWLLDNLGTGAGQNDALLVGATAGSLLQRMMLRAAGTATPPLQPASSNSTQAIGGFSPNASSDWSANAGKAAGAGLSAYRALNGTLTVQPAGGTVHALSEAAGTLSVSELALTSVRELSNDVTVSGAEEPAAYVTEVFVGDGTTSVFELQNSAYRDTSRTLLQDNFSGASVDPTLWTLVDPGSYTCLSGGGLTCAGGNGQDGQTTLTAVDPVEMGGTLLAELGTVQISANSVGMLAGFYSGQPVLANCFAGFRIRQQVSAGVTTTVLVPVLNGAEVGTAFEVAAGHEYTLRLRLHSVEMQRVMQRYYALAGSSIEGFGSLSGVEAPMDVVFELIDQGSASNTPATVLYDSVAAGLPLTTTPAICNFVLLNATQLFVDIGSVSLSRPGSLWVVSTLPSGASLTRLVGGAGQGLDCQVAYGSKTGSLGKVTFYAGRIPVVGELVHVIYRTEQRSVARLQDAASIASEALGGAAGTCRWLGKVLEPIARSSADCESAAQAILALSTNRAAAVAGSYSQWNPPQDIWPGDLLSIPSDGGTSNLLVRTVELIDGNSVPELIRYKITFANDWATEWSAGLGLKLSEEIAADVVLPQTASGTPGQVLANLQQLAVTSLTTTALQVDAGTAPPAGGGFEIRRRDWQFGAGVDTADLVLRSPVRSFSIPRSAQIEEFYVRMYDGSSPPLYSRFSSAVIINAPVG